MKTTLDLPDDVAMTLRLESARRGGRKSASLSRLVSEAVRQVYKISNAAPPPDITLQEGRVIIAKAEGSPTVDRNDILNALED